jgi:hypothetical protein
LISENKNIFDDDNADDFGFTFTTENELLQSSTANEVDDMKKRLLSLRSMFLPLLENLNKNPEKEMIKWPNRKAVIDSQIKKLKALTDI